MKLNILGTMWDVYLREIDASPQGQMRFGFMDATDHSLSIHSDTEVSWRIYLLLHEMFHALTYMGHLQFLKREDEFKHMDDEAKVDALASLLSEVLQRNNLLNMEALSSIQEPLDK